MAQIIKDLIKKCIPRPIIDHFIYLFYYRLFRRGYFAQSQLDKKLKKYINYEKGFFVELGANDGFTASNTLYFEMRKNWRGILIEPSPNLFLSCCFYRNKPGNKIFCNACVPFGFTEKYVDIDYAYLMSVSTNLKNDLDDIQSFLNDAKSNLKTHDKNLKFGSIARTLSSILDESDSPKIIDLLSLDVEGAELEVLKGLNFSVYKFKYMLIESRDFISLSSFLSNYSYSFVEKLSHHDYLFRCDSLSSQ